MYIFDLSFLKLFADKLALLKDQHRKFNLFDWKNENIFKAERIPVYHPKNFGYRFCSIPFQGFGLICSNLSCYSGQ